MTQLNLNENEAALYLGISKHKLRHWRMNGAKNPQDIAPQFIKIGRCVRYRKTDLDAYLANLPVYQTTAEVSATFGGVK